MTDGEYYVTQAPHLLFMRVFIGFMGDHTPGLTHMYYTLLAYAPLIVKRLLQKAKGGTNVARRTECFISLPPVIPFRVILLSGNIIPPFLPKVAEATCTQVYNFVIKYDAEKN